MLCAWGERESASRGDCEAGEAVSFARSEQPGCFLCTCPWASDSTARPPVQVTTGEGEKKSGRKMKRSHFTSFPLMPCCVPGEEKGRRTCPTGKADEAFPCRNQLSPGEKGRRFSDGQVIGLTNVSVLQVVHGPAARRLTTPAPNSFSLPWGIDGPSISMTFSPRFPYSRALGEITRCC